MKSTEELLFIKLKKCNLCIDNRMEVSLVRHCLQSSSWQVCGVTEQNSSVAIYRSQMTGRKNPWCEFKCCSIE